MKDKKIWIMIAALVVVLAIGAGGYLAFFHKSPQTVTQDNSQDEGLVVPTLSPDDIGLTLTSSREGKAVMLGITKTDGITGIDYEVTYNASSNGNTVPRGVIGHIDIKSGESSAQQEVVLGTCSDVCHYDTVVSPVQFVLKVSKSDNKTYQVTKTYSL